MCYNSTTMTVEALIRNGEKERPYNPSSVFPQAYLVDYGDNAIIYRDGVNGGVELYQVQCSELIKNAVEPEKILALLPQIGVPISVLQPGDSYERSINIEEGVLNELVITNTPEE